MTAVFASTPELFKCFSFVSNLTIHTFCLNLAYFPNTQRYFSSLIYVFCYIFQIHRSIFYSIQYLLLSSRSSRTTSPSRPRPLARLRSMCRSPFPLTRRTKKQEPSPPCVNVMPLSHSDLKLITFRSLFILVILTLRFSTPSRFGYCSSPWTQRLPCPPSSIPVASLH